MNAINESELDFAMWSALEQQYQLEGETLYRYLYLRSKVGLLKKGRAVKQEPLIALSRFLLNEWELNENDTVLLHGEELTLYCTGETGVHRIVADWHNRYSFLYMKGHYERELEAEWLNHQKEAKKKVQKWTKTNFYEIALKQAYLNLLNGRFQVTNSYNCSPIEGLDSAYERFPVRLELQYERYLHPHFQSHREASLLDEKHIEDYLVKHLEELEVGLRMIGRQIVLERGRIDILARDKEGKHVIIEVKIASDTDLIWQEAYYRKEIEALYGVPARFMVVAPKWEPHIMGMLLEQGKTEFKIFTPVVERNQVCSMVFEEKRVS